MRMPKVTWACAAGAARANVMTPAAAIAASLTSETFFFNLLTSLDLEARMEGLVVLVTYLFQARFASATWDDAAVLSEGGAGHQQRMEGYVFEEVEFEADGEQAAGQRKCDVLAGGSRARPGTEKLLARGAERGEGVVGGAGEFEAAGDERGVELDDALELDFDPELDGCRRQGLAFEHPSAALGEGGGEGGQKPLAVLVAVAPEVRVRNLISWHFHFHGYKAPGESGLLLLGHSSEARAGSRWIWRGEKNRGHDA
jgi:hypothetical protein